MDKDVAGSQWKRGIKKVEASFSPLDRARVVHKRCAFGQNHCVILLCLCGNKAGNPGQCTLTGGQSKHRNQLIVPLRNYYAKKKTRSIFSHLEGTSVVNKGFALWPKYCLKLYYSCGNKGGPPPPPSPCTLTGNQSKHRNQLIVPLPEVLLYNLLVLITDISSTQMREVYQAILWTILILVGNLRNLNMFKARLK